MDPSTPPPITMSSCNTSSVDLEGDSSSVHLDFIIRWNSVEGDSSGFPWCWTRCYYGYYSIALKHDTKDGSALRGTRVSILRSDVESGVPGGYPRVEHEAWPGLPSPCRKSSRRGDGVTSFVSLCSFPRDPKPLNGLDL